MTIRFLVIWFANYYQLVDEIVKDEKTSQMSVDDNTSVNKMIGDKMTVDKMTLCKLTVDKTT